MYTTRQNGLGFTAVAAPLIAGSGPAAPIVAGVLGALSVATALLSRIGRGRTEADAITPLQNSIGDRLGEMDQIIRTSTSVPQLQDLYNEAVAMGYTFLQHLTDPAFKDGRASQQAANDIMPLIDGTGGYTWPTMQGHEVNQDVWGNPTNGGRVGAIVRRILEIGGNLLPPTMTQAGGMGPTLQYPTPGGSYLPQAGWIPPTSPLSQVQPAGILSVGSMGDLLPLGLIVGLVWAVSKGR